MTAIVHKMLRRGVEALNSSGLDAAIGKRHAGCGSIIVLHSVVSDRKDYLFDNLRTSAAYLERLICFLRDKGVVFVSLDDAISRLAQKSTKRFVCLTLDDGFKDNLTVALPIFARYEVPFSVFVTTCFIDRSLDNWWTGVAEVIKKVDAVDAPGLPKSLPSRSLAEKVATYRTLLNAVHRGQLSRASIDDLFKKYRVSLRDVLDRDALDVAELKQISKHPLATIGGHTTTHLLLRQLAADTARQEMVENKSWLEATTGQRVDHFAYPFGLPAACGEREARLAHDIGFKTAVTTRIGNLFPEHLEHLTSLPRIRAFSQFESARLVEFQRCGGANTLLRRLRQPAVTMA